MRFEKIISPEATFSLCREAAGMPKLIRASVANTVFRSIKHSIDFLNNSPFNDSTVGLKDLCDIVWRRNNVGRKFLSLDELENGTQTVFQTL